MGDTQPRRRADAEGVRVQCRRLWPSDRAALRAHVLRLDPETRADRFMAVLNDRAAAAYADRALVNTGVMVGVFVDDVLRGIGEVRPLGTRGPLLGRQAEAAFVVERDYRREGFGARLFRRIVEAARSRGVETLQVRCLNRNGAMRRLALRHGAQLHPSALETEGAIPLARPTPLSMLSEGVAEALDLALATAASHPVWAAGRTPGGPARA